MADQTRTGKTGEESNPGNSDSGDKAVPAGKGNEAAAGDPAKAGGGALSMAKTDPVELIKADHRRVEELFAEFEKATSTEQKSRLANQICDELMVHTILEEEIFYPACQTQMDERLLNEAQVEHDGAKLLIIEIKSDSLQDKYFDAKIKVLSEEIKHHVAEEEKPNQGILAKAKQAGIATPELAQRLVSRKAELMDEAKAGRLGPPRMRAFRVRINAGAQGLQQQENDMPRYSTMTRERDDMGRFVSDDDDRGHSRSRSRDNGDTRERDDMGRFVSDDDDRGHSRSRSRDNGDTRERDDMGRFVSDDDDRGYSRSRSRDNGDTRERDDMGRFVSDDDDRGYSRSRSRDEGGYSRSRDDYDSRSRSRDNGDSRSRSRDDDDDRRGGRGQGGWFGDSRGHAEAAREGWENRGNGRSRSDDDDYRRGGRGQGGGNGDRDGRDDRGSSRSRSREDNGDDRRGQGHGGWFGDPEGHAAAAREGWDDRGRSSRSNSRDDDDRRGGRGHGGWFGDSEGHSRAARQRRD